MRRRVAALALDGLAAEANGWRWMVPGSRAPFSVRSPMHWTQRLPSRGRHAVSERDNLVLRLLQRMDRRVRLIGDVVNGVGAIVTGALVYLGVHYFLELSVTISTIIAAVVAGIASAAMRWDFEKGTSRLDKLVIFPRERSTPGEEFH